MTYKRSDFSHVRAHMRRFKSPHLTSSNKHIIYLHIICQFTLGEIATMTGISRKTVTRLLLGQKATERQLRRLQRACTPVYRQLEKQLSYGSPTLQSHYYREMIHHMISYGRWLTQDTRRR